MVLCQARSLRTSSTSAREEAKAFPRRSSGRLASSQARASLRNASCSAVKSKSIRSARPPCLDHHTAVDGERDAGDVARLVGGQEDGGPADVLGGLLALEG